MLSCKLAHGGKLTPRLQTLACMRQRMFPLLAKCLGIEPLDRNIVSNKRSIASQLTPVAAVRGMVLSMPYHFLWKGLADW